MALSRAKLHVLSQVMLKEMKLVEEANAFREKCRELFPLANALGGKYDQLEVLPPPPPPIDLESQLGGDSVKSGDDTLQDDDALSRQRSVLCS